MRLIDADELLKEQFTYEYDANSSWNFQVVKVEDIDNAPTIDAVEVVMCKDCIHYISRTEKDGGCRDGIIKGDITSVKYNDYCSYGESK